MSEPAWLTKARSYIGFHEQPNNRGIEEFIDLAHTGHVGDPWCAIFVNAMLEASGIPGTRSAAARSFERDPKFTRLDKPVLGCIATRWRGSPGSGSGHVGFWVGEDTWLSGNSSDQVKIGEEPRSQLTGYWWPQGVQLSGEANTIPDERQDYRSLIGGFFSSDPDDKSVKASIRTNNPGAINAAGPNGKVKWINAFPGFAGERIIGGGNHIAVFYAPEYGAAAWWTLMRKYRDAGAVTVEGIINRYGGEGQDYSQYIRDVSARTGFPASTVINLDDDQQLLRFAKAMFRQESGVATSLSDKQILHGFALARNGMKETTVPEEPKPPQIIPHDPMQGFFQELMQMIMEDIKEDIRELLRRRLLGGVGSPVVSPPTPPPPPPPVQPQAPVASPGGLLGGIGGLPGLGAWGGLLMGVAQVLLHASGAPVMPGTDTAGTIMTTGVGASLGAGLLGWLTTLVKGVKQQSQK